MFTTDDVIAGLGDLLVKHDGMLGSTFRGAAVDSRVVQPGDLFFALKGERTDGHLYVLDALRRGAAGVVISQPVEVPLTGIAIFHVKDTLLALQHLATYRRDRFPNMRVIGVTGSVGKTSTKELIAHVLGQKFRVVKSSGNLNSESGLPLTLLAMEEEPDKAVLEMAMYVPGDIRLLCRIARPIIGVVTNVGVSHLQRAGSLEAIMNAKAELPESLPPEGIAILNSDDPRVRAMATRTPARTVFYGLTAEADVRATDVASEGLAGIRFKLHYGTDTVPVWTPVFGQHRISNLLAAAAVALVEGMTLDEIAAALATAQVEIRMRVLQGKRGATIIDDTYNASPASMIGALEFLAELPGRRLALLGDMKELGPVKEASHRQVGVRAAACCDVLFVVGELGRLIGEAAAAAGLPNVRCFTAKEEAIQALLAEMQQGDFLLVKASRAMELEAAVAALAAEGEAA